MEPYRDDARDGFFIRQFDENVEQDELVWHRDHHSRHVDVLEGEGWQFQFDNHLPFKIVAGDHFTIKENEYHRLIKGSSKLKLRITEEIINNKK